MLVAAERNSAKEVAAPIHRSVSMRNLKVAATIREQSLRFAATIIDVAAERSSAKEVATPIHWSVSMRNLKGDQPTGDHKGRPYAWSGTIYGAV